jgi:hypothetical protein
MVLMYVRKDSLYLSYKLGPSEARLRLANTVTVIVSGGFWNLTQNARTITYTEPFTNLTE